MQNRFVSAWLVFARLILFVLALGPIRVALADEDPQALYQYTDKKGHKVFVNGKSSVPPEYEKVAKPVDLSKSHLNTQLGNEQRDQTNKQFDALVKEREKEKEKARLKAGPGASLGGQPTIPCVQKPVDNSPPWQKLAKDNTHWIVVGGLILLLLLASPYAKRNMPPDKWNKVLGYSIPLLLMLGMGSHFALRAGKGAKLARLMMKGDAPYCEDMPQGTLELMQGLKPWTGAGPTDEVLDSIKEPGVPKK